jgi:hypothetical protein
VFVVAMDRQHLWCCYRHKINSDPDDMVPKAACISLPDSHTYSQVPNVLLNEHGWENGSGSRDRKRNSSSAVVVAVVPSEYCGNVSRPTMEGGNGGLVENCKVTRN